MKFTKDNRVRLASDFGAIRKLGDKVELPPFVVYVKDAAGEKSRLGVVASRRVGNAVRRNHAKRVMRAIFRELYADIPRPLDILVYMRSSYKKFEYEDLKKYLKRAAK